LVRIGISQPNPRSRKVAIYVIDEAIRFKSIIQIESEEKYKKSTKLGQKGSRDPLLEFWDPPVSGSVEAKNFRFGTKMDGSEY